MDGPGGDEDQLPLHHPSSSPKLVGLLPLLGRVCQEAQVRRQIRGLARIPVSIARLARGVPLVLFSLCVDVFFMEVRTFSGKNGRAYRRLRSRR